MADDQRLPDETDLDGMSEQELDDILAKASGLAGDMVAELGVPVSDGIAEPPANQEATPNPDASVDVDLQELDRLVASAAGEVGFEDSAPDTSQAAAPDATATPPEGGSGGPAQDVPDFMLEFTGAAKPEIQEAPLRDEAAGAEVETNPEPDPLPEPAQGHVGKPGVVGTGIPLTAATATQASTGDTEARPGVGGNGEDAESVGATQGALARIAGTLRDRAADGAWLACNRGVGLLEHLHRPFDRLGMGVRTIAGWVALATLGTAVIVWIVSLF